jgi:two-component system NtrC family sensor kinase
MRKVVLSAIVLIIHFNLAIIKTHISIGDFNNFYRIIKKSKNKTFNRTQVSHIDLDFLGTFLAREFTLPKYNIILVLSRNDFLKPTKEEVVYFDTFNNVLPPLLNSLLISESTNKKIVSLIQCLYELPYPITITRSNEPIFKNKAYKDIISVDDITLLDKQILNNQYELKIYGMKEEEGHTSDIFHFQRISLLGELLNTLKHELSNPLFGLGLASELVYSELSDDDENKELVFEITNNIKRSQSIIDNFSKLYQNINTTRPVLVKKIIHESLTLTKSETRGVEKVTQFQKTIDDNYEIMINPTWLVQILFNLIVNSAQAMKEMVERRPLIQLSCFDKDNFLNIIVSDNGPGIDEEKFELLFKPFYTTKNNGTGLGLPISKNLAQKMNGDLSAKLNKPNPGITFTLKLPVNYENSHH